MTSFASKRQAAQLQGAGVQAGPHLSGSFITSAASKGRPKHLQDMIGAASNSSEEIEEAGLQTNRSFATLAASNSSKEGEDDEEQAPARGSLIASAAATQVGRALSNASAELGPARSFRRSLLTREASVRRAEQLQVTNKVVYGPCERCLSVQPGAVTLDFEVEPGAHLVMTPTLLALRGGYEVGDGGGGVGWPRVSSFFDLGIEGRGLRHSRGMPKFNSFLQSPEGQLEITSKPLRPAAVLAGLLPDLKDYLEQLGRQSSPAVLPESGDIKYTRGWTQQRVHQSKGRYSPLHWTVGVELGRVPELLAATSHKLADRLKELCQGTDDVGCAPEYQGVVGLAATSMQEALSCKQVCGHPKRCLKPWLVRTHFGDMVRHLREVVGDDVVERLPGDVFKVLGKDDGDSAVLFTRPREYWGLVEMAEYSGFVPSRLPLRLNFKRDDADADGGAMQPMPSNGPELLSLAQRMQASQKTVQKRLAAASCDLHRGDDESRPRSVTARDWLDGLLRGRDLMSDRDSPISELGLSKVVWKSMGAWRMKGDGRVYLECRRSLLCLPDGATDGNLVLNEIARVAAFMQRFEHTTDKHRQADQDN